MHDDPIPDQNPFTLDHDQLHALASADVVRAGLRHCKDNRVTDLTLDAGHLSANVEDEETGEVVALDIAYPAYLTTRFPGRCLRGAAARI
jgi:hypothetical protein